MRLDIVRTNFSQFSDDIMLRVSHGSSVFTSDVSPAEFVDLALNLVDVAYDILNKAGRNDVLDQLSNALEKAAKPKVED